MRLLSLVIFQTVNYPVHHHLRKTIKGLAYSCFEETTDNWVEHRTGVDYKTLVGRRFELFRHIVRKAALELLKIDITEYDRSNGWRKQAGQMQLRLQL